MSTVLSFQALSSAQQPFAGGKGATLARLYQAGYPVPDGFILLPEAFDGDGLRDEAEGEVRRNLRRLRGGDGDAAFAVRSSALSEDSVRDSFAGEFETVLGVGSDEEVYDAIRTVRQSRRSARVAAYSQAKGVSEVHEMAVVVQRMVPADLAGVLFTADPITGNRTYMDAQFVYGLGDRLVSGEENPHSFRLKRPRGQYDGPPEMKRFARQLYRLAGWLERDLGGPQDVEWAVAGRRLYLLQSRPITTLQPPDPASGEWNDSLTGDYLWTSDNAGEAFPDVMTPFTWSMWELYLSSNGFTDDETPHRLFGNIGGRPYMNLSLTLSAIAALRLPWRKMVRAAEETWGRIPAEVEIPILPFSFWWALSYFIPFAFRTRRQARAGRRRVPAFIAETPALAEQMRAKIAAAQTLAQLLGLWREELEDRLAEAFRMLLAGLGEYRTLSRKLHIEFERLLGEADANALLSGMSTDADPLASMGLLIGLAKVNRGKMSREEYLRQYGHRCAQEMELSHPRPEEDPGWLDSRLAQVAGDEIDLARMLAEQRRRHEEAWERLRAKVSHKAAGYRKRLDRMAEAAHTRESSRSEAVRMVGVLRAFALRAGELSGLGDDVFFLLVEEMLALLAGDESACDLIPARREAYARYSELPPYPRVIRGRFDPFEWAVDPNRRSDHFDAQAPVPTPASGVVTGFAGAAGTVEGIVRRLDGVEEGDQLLPGEILVAATTNVGWTVLFPRAAAVVTDVGAPFSHAAIVARELGIPAVVGCGDATTRLRTGDRVRVLGGQGVVEVLESVE